MKHYILSAAFLLCTIAHSSAVIIIKQGPSPTKPEEMCWTVLMGKKPLPENTIVVSSAKVEGDKLTLTVEDTKAIPEAEMVRLVKYGVYIPRNPPRFFTMRELEELGVKGLKGVGVTSTSEKGQVAVATSEKGKGPIAARGKIKFPPITITITIKIGH